MFSRLSLVDQLSWPHFSIGFNPVSRISWVRAGSPEFSRLNLRSIDMKGIYEAVGMDL